MYYTSTMGMLDHCNEMVVLQTDSQSCGLQVSDCCSMLIEVALVGLRFDNLIDTSPRVRASVKSKFPIVLPLLFFKIRLKSGI